MVIFDLSVSLAHTEWETVDTIYVRNARISLSGTLLHDSIYRYGWSLPYLKLRGMASKGAEPSEQL